jgi:hypothetical protein
MTEEPGAALNRYVSATICAVSDARGMVTLCCRPLYSAPSLVLGRAQRCPIHQAAFPILCASRSHAGSRLSPFP